MVFFLSKAFVSAVVVIVGALLGIQTLNHRQVEAKDPIHSLPEKRSAEDLVQSGVSKAEFETMNVGRADGSIERSELDASESSSLGPWPECVGKTGQECVVLIEELAPDVKGSVFIIPYGSMVTMDYRTNRVRVFVDEQGVVVKSPGRG